MLSNQAPPATVAGLLIPELQKTDGQRDRAWLSQWTQWSRVRLGSGRPQIKPRVHITDWTVICTANWSWHPHQPVPVVKKNKPQSNFYKDAPFTKLWEKTCGLSALPWRPNSMAANMSWRRRHHSSRMRPWSCRLQTLRRRRRSLAFLVGLLAVCVIPVVWHELPKCIGQWGRKTGYGAVDKL